MNRDMNCEEDKNIPLTEVARLTGFPVDYIKKELFLEGDYIALKEFRDSIFILMEQINKEIKGA